MIDNSSEETKKMATNLNPVTLSFKDDGQLMASTENSLSAMYNHISTISNREVKDEIKLQSAQQISGNLENAQCMYV